MRSPGNRGLIWVVVAANLLAALLAVATNLATEVVPDAWRPHLWIAWPVLIALVLVGIPVAIRLQRQQPVPLPIAGERAAFSRRAMIARLRTVWIHGVLDRSLYRRTIIELGLAERPDLLKRAWDIVMEAADEPPRHLDRQTALVDVVEHHRGLLVLGAPGAGKTTMLLTLLEDLLIKAERDPVAPIPVVFPLSSWPSSGKPLAEWFVEELCGPLYGLPPDLARDWIANDRVLPLLDGLDEVALEFRLRCAREIDDFHRGHSILPLIVASRIADYDALRLRLSLGTALLIQPLTRPQTEEYLDRLGEPLAGLRQTLDHEPSLWELVRTPFLLNVAVRAYHGLPAADVATEGTPEQRQADLITAYVQRAFERRRTGPRISTADAVRTLTFIARALGRRLETYFYVEDITSEWLPDRLGRLAKVVASLPLALLLGATSGLLMGLPFGPPIGIGSGALAAAVFATVLLLKEPAELRYRLFPSRRREINRSLADWATFGGCMALALGIVGGLLGLLGGLVGLIADGSFLESLGRGGLLGVTAGALLGALVPAVASSPFSGKSALRELPSGTGIRDAVWFGVAFATIVGVPATVILWAVAGQAGVFTGLIIAVTAGYAYSGLGLVMYWLCRILLGRTGVIPQRMLGFLDFAVDHTVMLKVGGGYIFTHRLLLEHFAGIEPDEVKTKRVRNGLSAIDLRPRVLLERAVQEAVSDNGNPVNLLAYTGSIVPADAWAPVAMEVADILESRLSPHPEVPTGKSPANSLPVDHLRLMRTNRVGRLVKVFQMVIAAGHPEYSASAAIRLAELLVAESESSALIRSELLTWSEAKKALETVAASDSSASGRVAELLATLRPQSG